MSARLTRQDMKRDEVQEWMGRVYLWFGDHWQKVLWGAAGVVVLGLLGVLAMVYLQHRGAEGRESLSRALTVYEAPINVLAAKPDDAKSPSFASEEERRSRARELFSETRDRYGSTRAGHIAGVYLGRIAAAEGDLDTARDLWTRFLDTDKDDALAASVQLDLYSLARQQGRLDEVIAELRGAVESPDGRVPLDSLLWELGISLEDKGDKEESRRIFQRLVDEYPASPYSTEARQRVGGGGLSNFQIGT